MVRAAATAGFAFVGARLLNGQPGRDLAPLMESLALRRETIACLHDAGIGFSTRAARDCGPRPT
jgi:hypothetical protein